jgi:hypothetical protein
MNHLKESGFLDEDGENWPIELFFSGDWKIMALLLGANAANSNYFCLYCECHKKYCGDLSLIWLNNVNTKGDYMNQIFFLSLVNPS